jgi:hypothetical protein
MLGKRTTATVVTAIAVLLREGWRFVRHAEP